MTDPHCTCTFIVAGYEQAVKKHLLAANEGLERRFASVFVIEPLKANQLAAVFLRHLRKGWRCSVPQKKIAALLQKNPPRHGAAGVVALARLAERSHISRLFPNRVSRRLCVIILPLNTHTL